MKILTKSHEKKDSAGNIKREAREAEVEAPLCLQAENLTDLVSILTEEVAFNKIKAQLTIDFRSHIRGKLESQTDGVPTNSDDDIISVDYTDWKPEARTRMSAQEKAIKLVGGMSAEDLAVALAAAGIKVAEENDGGGQDTEG